MALKDECADKNAGHILLYLYSQVALIWRDLDLCSLHGPMTSYTYQTNIIYIIP